MHHKKGWISKRKEGLFRFKLHLNKKNNKYEKHFKTKWVPESFVAKILEALTHKLEAEEEQKQWELDCLKYTKLKEQEQ